jgi:hypothetical protein
MKNYGRTSLEEFLGSRVVYRNLVPADPNLPGLAEAAAHAGLPAGRLPRKSEADYARVILYLLERAQELRRVRRPLQRLLYVGDTRLLDGSAFANVCTAGGWAGLAFIGAETSKPAAVEIVPDESGGALYLANRWAALADFDAYAAAHGLPVDESTAVIVDIDKTALGARGRNGGVIDAARIQALQETVAGLLGSAFDPGSFLTAYNLLNEPEFHPFTADNQDNLAYLCLVLGSGLVRLEALVADLRDKRLASFEQFIAGVDARARELPPGLSAVHADIYACVRAGDPTPFKSFRRKEYLLTIGCFGRLGDAAPVEKLLAEEILITQEVRALALDWQERGALLFGLSDKPDEAAGPTPELAAQGCLPIHRATTHAVGS